jgi:hypothetical protein
LAAFVAGAEVAGFVAVALALVAALLNATIALCLGCEVYLLARRLTTRTPDRYLIPAQQEARSTT